MKIFIFKIKNINIKVYIEEFGNYKYCIPLKIINYKLFTIKYIDDDYYDTYNKIENAIKNIVILVDLYNNLMRFLFIV